MITFIVWTLIAAAIGYGVNMTRSPEAKWKNQSIWFAALGVGIALTIAYVAMAVGQAQTYGY